jgi:hypothetical protein
VIRERGGYGLMPEWETKPANHYLPRAITSMVQAAVQDSEQALNAYEIKR